MGSLTAVFLHQPLLPFLLRLWEKYDSNGSADYNIDNQ